MKYLKLFNNHSLYQDDTDKNTHITVSFCDEEGHVHFDNDVIEDFDYVDLALPSGTLWATKNVGAETIYDYGTYFAWGETEGKTEYSWNTYKYGSAHNVLTKYCTNSTYGNVDDKTTLDLEDDAAHVNMGGDWHIPSKSDYEELIDNTDITVVNEYKGTPAIGWLFTSKNNGKELFMPSTGYISGLTLNCEGVTDTSIGWTAELDDLYPYISYAFGYVTDHCVVASGERTLGMPVRAIKK